MLSVGSLFCIWPALQTSSSCLLQIQWFLFTLLELQPPPVPFCPFSLNPRQLSSHHTIWKARWCQPSKEFGTVSSLWPCQSSANYLQLYRENTQPAILNLLLKSLCLLSFFCLFVFEVGELRWRTTLKSKTTKPVLAQHFTSHTFKSSKLMVLTTKPSRNRQEFGVARQRLLGKHLLK